MERPSISVIIPAYNADKYLQEAIDSILSEGYSPLEIIVVDDGSTDGTRDVAQSFGDAVHYQYQAQAGAAAARNHGIRLAKSDLIAFLDADDIWVPGKLALQLAVLESQPEVSVVFAYAKNFIKNEKGELEYENPLPAHLPGAMLIRKAELERVGLFPENFQRAETVEFFVRLREAGANILMLPETLLLRRIHGENLGFRAGKDNLEYLNVVRGILERKRKAGN